MHTPNSSELAASLPGGPELTLYHAAHSTCSQKVRLCLAEKGLSYESRILRIKEREHQSPEYLALNPNGVIPTLVHAGDSIIDSSVICEYLDEVFDQPRLSPATPLGRARMRAWLRYLEEVPTAAIRIPSINKLFVPILEKLGPQAKRELTVQAPLRRHLYERIGPQGFAEQETQESLEQLRASLCRAQKALERGPWLNGDAFSLADIVFTPIVVRLEDLDLHSLWADLSEVEPWYQRIQARPSFSQAFMPGSRISLTHPDMV
ncbi:MAG: glutathione S-transferase family protein [Proteobacteria bacterium]|nr:glutathione S-transferase family protein [Pseudomonadota bacterium]